MINTTANPIQRGLSTHHQDQSITLPSFNPMNKRVSALANPIPPDEDELSLAIILV